MSHRSRHDPEHVAAEIRRLVVPADQPAAITLLNKVRGNGCDVLWLQLAALNLAAGRIDRLPQWVEQANQDARDLTLATQRHLDPVWDARYQWPVEASGR